MNAAAIKHKAKYRCNVCGTVVTRRLGNKVWTKSFCLRTGKTARLYRVSAPLRGHSHI